MVRTRTAYGRHANKAMHNERNSSTQYDAYKRIKDILTPEEESIFMRGRNAHVRSAPKNVDPAKYHTATGLEAVFGALWLQGKHERLNELFSIIVND